MGLRDHLTGKSSGSPTQKSADAPIDGASNDDTEVLDEETGNVLLALVAQLRPGMDLSRVALPTFVLEPRSMLERIGDSLGHAECVFNTSRNEDAVERFIDVVRYFLSGWHIKVPGVKKPYNPVLGEYFRCRYEYSNGTVGYYIAEQVSHHPPISAFYYTSPENELEIYGELRPKSKFLGNSAATLMGGTSKLRFLDRPDDGLYVISMPNMYARGILFGKQMVFELGDDCKVSNNANDIVCDLDFKTKGFFSGSYNAIAGKIKADGKDVGDISGLWSEQMELKRSKGSKDVLFDARGAKPSPKLVAPLAEQGEYESRRLWSKVTDAIKTKDMKAATDNKVDIEEAQRERAAKREESAEKWAPRYFRLEGDEHVPLFQLPTEASERIPAVHKWIFGDDKNLPERTKPSAAPAATNMAKAGSTSSQRSTAEPAGEKATSSTHVEQPGAANSRVLP